MRSKNRVIHLFFLRLVVAAILLQTGIVYAGDKPVEIRSIRIVDGAESDFVVSGTANFQFYMFSLKDPDRLIIDCRPALLAFPITGALKGSHPVVNRIRAAHSEPGVVRIVFELKQPAKYSALMTGTDLRIRIAANRQSASTRNAIASERGGNTIQPASSSDGSQSASSKAGVELSVSTNQQAARTEPSPGKTASKKPKVDMRGYVVDRFQRKVVGSSGREASMGSSYGMNVKYRKKNKSKNAALKVDYKIAGHEYAEPYADDYMSQDFKLGYELNFGSNWTLKNVGRVGLYEYGSEYGFRPELSYRFNERSSMSFFAGHRTKVVDSYQDRTDQDRYFGVKYHRRLGNNSLELAYQRSFNDSEKDRYDYIRSRYSIAYNVPWTKTAKTTFKFDYSPREYQARFIDWLPEEDLEFGTLRFDQGWTFSLLTRIRISRHLELVPRYMYQDRISNDPSVDFDTLHVSSIALRGRW